MVYFVDPYKKYYDILSGASNSSSSISSTSDKISSADKIISNINSSITGSQWTELGVEELAGNVILYGVLSAWFFGMIRYFMGGIG